MRPGQSVQNAVLLRPDSETSQAGGVSHDGVHAALVFAMCGQTVTAIDTPPA